MTDKAPILGSSWCNDRGRCKRSPTLDHHGCCGHNAKTNEPCRIGWGCHLHHGEWNEILEPFGQLQHAFSQRIEALLMSMSDDELRDVVRATDHLSEWNCWYATYHARDAVQEAALWQLRTRGQRLSNWLIEVGQSSGSTDS